MKILILHDQVPDVARKDETDAAVQARAVAAALEILGHEWMTLGIMLDLDAAREAIVRLAPDLVFNLAESLGGHGRLIHVAPALLETLGAPFTGCSAEAQFVTSNKLLAKQMMRAAGVATAPWFTLDDLRGECKISAGGYIVKSVWEHASLGLDEDSVVEADSTDALREAIEERLERLAGEGFAEAYIDGREFNLAMLADPNSPDGLPQILPAAEIVFEGYTADQPKVVGYRAKWEEDSFAYTHTPQRYDFPASDAALLEQLRSIALQCWRVFKLNGHARVDFRVDERGRPWVLEVNANPCLSPDAGFAAALVRAKIPFAVAIDRILRDVEGVDFTAETQRTRMGKDVSILDAARP